MNLCDRLRQTYIKSGLDAVHTDPLLMEHILSCESCQSLLDAEQKVSALLDGVAESIVSDHLVELTDAKIHSDFHAPVSQRRVKRIATVCASTMMFVAAMGIGSFWIDYSHDISSTMDYFSNDSQVAIGSDVGNSSVPSGGFVDDRLSMSEASSSVARNKPASSSPPVYAEENESLTAALGASMTDGEARWDSVAVATIEDYSGIIEKADESYELDKLVSDLAEYKSFPSKKSKTRPRDGLAKQEQVQGVRSAAPKLSFNGGLVSEKPQSTMPLREQQQKLAGDVEQWKMSNSSSLRVDGLDVITEEEVGLSTPSFESFDSFTATARKRVAKSDGPAAASDRIGRVEDYDRQEMAALNAVNLLDGASNPVISESNADSKNKQSDKFGELSQRNTNGSLAGFVFYQDGSSTSFWPAYFETEQLSFFPPAGYWANTYVPGDPQLRLLQSRLKQWDRSALGDVSLENAIEPFRQQMDSPKNSALDLVLRSDVSALESRTRVRLQVGIKAIEQRQGQRPTMNIAVILDVPNKTGVSEKASVRALLDAIHSVQQAGDKISVISTGPSGGVLVPSGEFKYGSVHLLKQSLFARDYDTTQFTSLSDAVAMASAQVMQNDDPSEPIGSSLVLLITANSIKPQFPLIKSRVNSNAKLGISFSLIPLGERPESELCEDLVLAGLGNRRYLLSPEHAVKLMEEELWSSSRAVARAARLSIRLGASVKLVDILGSHILQQPQVKQLKDVEKGMDQRLAKNFGIKADRGDDEQGIQIVIPSIFSGDSISVVLDLLVEGPGDIADVTLRYKDLSFLRNGLQKAHYKLNRGESLLGKEQRQVIKNILGYQFSKTMLNAANNLKDNCLSCAMAELDNFKASLQFLYNSNTLWKSDSELKSVDALISDYSRILTGLSINEKADLLTGLVDSLRLAAWNKSNYFVKE